MATALQYKKELEDKIKDTKTFVHTDDTRAAKEYFEERREVLQLYRKNKKIEEIWKAADKAYVPHTLSTKKGKKVLASDDELGWRSSQVILNKDDDWMEDSVPPNPYIKIQTALGIIVDRNPTAIFNPGAKRYEKNTNLVENLYHRSWETAKSKSTLLKPFVLNMGKYGIGVGRTFPLKLTRTLRNGNKFTYYDDIFRENLSPWNVWFDDAAVVGNPMSCNDVVYYKDYSWDKFVEQFGHLPNFKYVKPKKQVLNQETRKLEDPNEEQIGKYQIRVWFYENLSRDWFYVQTDEGIPLVDDEIPKVDRNKKLSIWSAPWTLRNDKDLEGIGIYEAMRNDHKLHTKIRGMTMDQLVLSIYKEFFYSGTDTMETDGQMKTAPGRGRQVADPQNIRWNEVPGPGQDAYKGLEYQEQKIEDATGVTKQLQGEVTGKTAFETSQATEAALKRLKTPLENITDALEIDAYLSIGIMEDLYSIPKIKLIAEDRYIEPFELEQLTNEDNQYGAPGEGPEVEEQYKEMPLKVERGQDGKIQKTKENNFFELRPDDVTWEGMINIKAQSIVANSELLERVSTVEMANLLIPMFQMPPEIALKPAKEILKTYDKDPEDWLPDTWLQPQQEQPQNPLFTDQSQPGAPTSTPQAPTVTPPSNVKGPVDTSGIIPNSLKQLR